MARLHGMNHVKFEFDADSCKNFLKGEHGFGPTITVSWKEGYHGGDEKIRIFAKQDLFITEDI